MWLRASGKVAIQAMFGDMVMGADRRQEVYPQWSQAQETSAGIQESRSGHPKDEHSSGRHHLWQPFCSVNCVSGAKGQSMIQVCILQISY